MGQADGDVVDVVLQLGVDGHALTSKVEAADERKDHGTTLSEDGRHGATVGPWGGVAVKAGGKEALRRYLPFLAIVGLQLVLLARGPTRTVTVSGNAGTG